MFHAEVVEDAGDDGIDHVEHGLRAVIEGGNGGDDFGAGFQDGDDIARLDQVPGRFARDEDELALFLQEDVRGADDGAVGVAVRDAPDGAHGAGDDDHGVEPGRAADVGHLHRGIAVDGEAVRDGELADLGLGDLPGMAAEGDMDVMLPACGGVVVQDLEQSLRIERAAGPRDGHDEFHALQDTRFGMLRTAVIADEWDAKGLASLPCKDPVPISRSAPFLKKI